MLKSAEVLSSDDFSQRKVVALFCLFAAVAEDDFAIAGFLFFFFLAYEAPASIKEAGGSFLVHHFRQDSSVSTSPFFLLLSFAHLGVFLPFPVPRRTRCG